MTIPAAIPFPIYGPASSSDVTGSEPVAPDRWDCVIAGRGFMLDLASDEYRWGSTPLLRQQADSSDRPSEASINPEDLWRRTQESWHKGAGQKFYDQTDSDPDRFWSSKGVDPWTRGEIGILSDVELVQWADQSNLRMAVAGGRLYVTHGQEVSYTSDGQAWSSVTGVAAADPIAISSDGFTVYLAYATNGIYTTNTGVSTASSWATGNLEGAKWVQGRLFAWNNANLYNVTGSGALPSALYTQPNSDFTWVDVAAAGGAYYAAGFSGDKSLIYYTTVKSDGSGLEALLEAAQLPDGEIVRSIYGYLGFVLIGTDKGLRFATTEGGPLNLGSLIRTGEAVRCFEGQDRFVWFGWANYDDTSTGLGRVDLSVFNEAQPAYASDLMATAQGAVRSVVTFLNKRWFSVSGAGFYTETGEEVPEATLETGQITFGLADDKLAHHVTVRHEPDSQVTASLSADRGTYVDLTGTTDGTGTSFPAGQIRAESYQIRFTLTAGATVTRWRLRGYPSVPRVEEVLLPILLGREFLTRDLVLTTRDVSDDLEFLLALEDSGEDFSFTDGLRDDPLVLEDHQWRPHHPDKPEWAGLFMARCKRFPTE